MPPEAPLCVEIDRNASRSVRREGGKVDPAEVVGLILAGGRSSRMGREKALLRVDEETLIERQLRTLRAAGVRKTFLSLRPELIPLLPDSVICDDVRLQTGSAPCTGVNTSSPSEPTLLLDEDEGLGPLAGIVAAMAQSPERHLLVLAVDMPGVRPTLLSHILSVATPNSGVAPKVGGMWEPLCAIYPPGTLDLAQSHLRNERGSSAHLLDTLASLGRVRALPLSRDGAVSLRSWNCPEDVEVVPHGTCVPHFLPLLPD